MDMPQLRGGMGDGRVAVYFAILRNLTLACVVSQPPPPNYMVMSCEQLLGESKRLVRKKTDRSEYLLEDEAAAQTATADQIAAVKKAITVKKC